MTDSTQTLLQDLVERVKGVRRWLVALALLKAGAAACLGIALFITLYILVDHWIHLGVVGRLLSLAILLAGLIGVLFYVLRSLVGHISCSNAANHIERQLALEQQLVTAVEYYEGGEGYPYSRSLADHLVRQISRKSEGLDFASTIPKWQAIACALAVVLGLGLATFYLQHNVRFLSRYLTRLMNPLAAVEPIPTTQLTVKTGDILTEPNVSFELAASIEGYLPREGKLLVGEAEDETVIVQNMTLAPTYDSEEKPQFAAHIALPVGRYAYHFQTSGSQSDTHAITVANLAKIASIYADVTPPFPEAGERYTEQVEDQTLAALKNSTITLRVNVTESLSGADVTGVDGQAIESRLDAEKTFSCDLVATKEGFVNFRLTNAGGVTNDNIPGLQVLLKKDAPPEFNVLSPGGDYLATNVSSVPIAFEVSDDFGLKAAALVIEMGADAPKTYPASLVQGTRSSTVAHTLELDTFDLDIGDSILYYATAEDVDVGLEGEHGEVVSDIYFIEIRPYRRLWHRTSPGLPHDSTKQGLEIDPALVHTVLPKILEYTRAILKKTWVIANKPDLSDEDRERLESINQDLDFVTEQLTLIRDDPRARFTRSQVAAINEVLDSYGQASQALSRHDARAAVPPEKNAYQALRKLILMLHMAMGSASGTPPPPGPDAVTLEEEVHLVRFEKEQIQWELERIANKLEELEAEQEQLKREFDRFLEQARKDKQAQETTDEESRIDSNEQTEASQDNRENGGSEGGGGQEESTASVEGVLPPPPEGQNAQSSGSGDVGAAGQGQGVFGAPSTQEGAREATREEQLFMLQAKQASLKETAEQLRQELARLRQAAGKQDKAEAKELQKAEELVKEAIQEMAAFEQAMSRAFYESGGTDASLAEARRALEQASIHLSEAVEQVIEQTAQSEDEKLAEKYERLAKELSQLAQELENTVDPAARQELLARFEEITKFIEEMPGRNPYEDIFSGRADPTAPDYGGGGNLSDTKPWEVAHHIAHEFWSKAIQARKQRSALSERPASDAEYYRVEKQFYEEAAKFGE